MNATTNSRTMYQLGTCRPNGVTIDCNSTVFFCVCSVGHGRSEGEKIEVDSFGVYPRDSIQFMDLMKAEYPDCPLFAFGYSIVRNGIQLISLSYLGCVLRIFKSRSIKSPIIDLDST